MLLVQCSTSPSFNFVFIFVSLKSSVLFLCGQGCHICIVLFFTWNWKDIYNIYRALISHRSYPKCVSHTLTTTTSNFFGFYESRNTSLSFSCCISLSPKTTPYFGILLSTELLYFCDYFNFVWTKSTHLTISLYSHHYIHFHSNTVPSPPFSSYTIF